MLTRRVFLAAPAAVAASAAGAVPPPAAFGATPTERQLGWHEMETAAFLHFTVNTFTGKFGPNYADERGKRNVRQYAFPNRLGGAFYHHAQRRHTDRELHHAG